MGKEDLGCTAAPDVPEKKTGENHCIVGIERPLLKVRLHLRKKEREEASCVDIADRRSSNIRKEIMVRDEDEK